MDKIKIFQISDHNFGLEAKGDSISFLVPKELMPEDNLSLHRQIKLLETYSVILRKYYKNKSKKNKKVKDLIKKENVDKKFEHIQSLIFIFNDYIQNDLYKIQTKNYNKRNQKINWNQTFKKNDVIVSKNKIIHSGFISEHNSINKKSDYYKLYLFALDYSLRVFLGESFIEQNEIFKYSKTKIKYEINCFLDEHFSDRDIEIAKALENFYFSSNKNIFDKDLFNTPYHEKFENIWEFMVNEIIPKNDSKLLDFSLKKEGEYKKVFFDDNNKICEQKDSSISCGLSYIIDHIIYKKHDKYICILDSKFYDFYNDYNASPKTNCIGKQANYKNRILKKLNNDSVLNISIKNFFIFPKKNKDNIEIELFAKHYVEDDNDYDIYCIALDIDTVVSHFNKSQKYNYFIEYLMLFKDV